MPYVPSGSGGSGGTVKWFADDADRDSYYTSNPNELKAGISVGIGDPVVAWTYDGATWVDGALAFKGDKGATGANGTDGKDGEGVPTGGTAGQILSKQSAADFDTQWVDNQGGSGDSTPLVKYSNIYGDNLSLALDGDVISRYNAFVVSSNEYAILEVPQTEVFNNITWYGFNSALKPVAFSAIVTERNDVTDNYVVGDLFEDYDAIVEEITLPLITGIEDYHGTWSSSTPYNSKVDSGIYELLYCFAGDAYDDGEMNLSSGEKIKTVSGESGIIYVSSTGAEQHLDVGETVNIQGGMVTGTTIFRDFLLTKFDTPITVTGKQNKSPQDDVTYGLLNGDLVELTGTIIQPTINENIPAVGVELDTGKKWIDGKPIYCQVFTGTTSTGNETVDLLTGVVDKLISTSGEFIGSSGAGHPIGTTFPNFTDSSWNGFIVYTETDGDLARESHAAVGSFEYDIVVEYTKL